MKRLLHLIMLVLCAVWLSACKTVTSTQSPPLSGPPTAGTDLPIGQPRPASRTIETNNAAVAAARNVLGESKAQDVMKWTNKSFDSFERQVPREAGTNHYIVNGDTVISDKKRLQEFFEKEVRKRIFTTGLSVHAPGGAQAIWNNTQKRNLVYCVSNNFGAQKNTVVAAMANAAAAWEAQGDIDFHYSAVQDSQCDASNAQVLFDVRRVSGQPYLARAFFPDDVRSNRNVLIDSSALVSNSSPSLTAVLRHEIGHTLGFRHEHTRPEAGVCFEDNDWVPLTDYDAFSVMHYPQCNGLGGWLLNLTALDAAGVACVYGQGPGFTGSLNDCLSPPPPPPASCVCGPQTVIESGSVNNGQTISFGPYAVTEGTQFIANMSGSGDPDLYVRFVIPPDLNGYDCRPYRTGANEVCDLTVPQNSTQAFVMVRGYTSGTYQLVIEHTPSP